MRRASGRQAGAGGEGGGAVGTGGRRRGQEELSWLAPHSSSSPPHDTHTHKHTHGTTLLTLVAVLLLQQVADQLRVKLGKLLGQGLDSGLCGVQAARYRQAQAAKSNKRSQRPADTRQTASRHPPDPQATLAEAREAQGAHSPRLAASALT